MSLRSKSHPEKIPLGALWLLAVLSTAWIDRAAAEEHLPEQAPMPSDASEPQDHGAAQNSPSAGQDQDAPSSAAGEADLALAQQHFDRGIILVRREHWEAALAEFDASLELHPSHTALFNRALCLQNLLRFPEAIEVFEAYLEQYGRSLTEERRALVEARITEIRSLLTELVVEVNVEGAVVLVDHQVVGLAPLEGPVELVSGLHQVEVQCPGYRTEQRIVPIVSGSPQHLRFELSAPRGRGGITVSANVDNARVHIDGYDVGTVPYRGAFGEGAHEVLVRAVGYRPERQTLEVRANADSHVSLTLRLNRHLHRAWFWSMVGSGITLALSTAALGTAVHLLHRRYDASDPNARERYDQGRALMNGADVSLGLALGFAVAAVVLSFWTDFGNLAAESVQP